MAAVPYHVAEAFSKGRTDRSGAFFSTGQELYSYGLKLAHLENGRIVVDHDLANTRSVTTARHIRALLAVIPVEEWPEDARRKADKEHARRARVTAASDQRFAMHMANLPPVVRALLSEPQTPAEIADTAETWLRTEGKV